MRLKVDTWKYGTKPFETVKNAQGSPRARWVQRDFYAEPNAFIMALVFLDARSENTYMEVYA